tara:strand:+ start:298 stop:2016 length:1719 start_codon:yes stop_codon:yes gene_type:complete
MPIHIGSVEVKDRNLVLNGDFKSDITSWTNFNATTSWSNGMMKVVRSGGSGLTTYQDISTISGRTYTLSAKIESHGSRADIRAYDSSGNLLVNVSGRENTGRTHHVSGEFTAVGTTTRIYTTGDNDGATHFYDEITVNERTSSNNTGEWPAQPPSLLFNFTSGQLDPRFSFKRDVVNSGDGEVASYVTSGGKIKRAVAGVPRFDHDWVTKQPLGLLIEDDRINASLYSRRFDVTATGSWVPNSGASVTANTDTAPDDTSSGIYMGDELSSATGDTFNGAVIRQLNTTTNDYYTFSIYIKLKSATTATIYIRDGNSGASWSQSTSADQVGHRGWQRVWVTSQSPLTAGDHYIYVGNTNGTIALWGAQFEKNARRTSYIYNDSTATERGTEQHYMSHQTFHEWYGHSQGAGNGTGTILVTADKRAISGSNWDGSQYFNIGSGYGGYTESLGMATQWDTGQIAFGNYNAHNAYGTCPAGRKYIKAVVSWDAWAPYGRQFVLAQSGDATIGYSNDPGAGSAYRFIVDDWDTLALGGNIPWETPPNVNYSAFVPSTIRTWAYWPERLPDKELLTLVS